MSESRPPTPSEIKVDPSIELHHTLYPYLNFKQDGLSPFINAFKKAIGPYNPFAVQGVATSDRMAVGMKNGSHFYKPDAYPNGVYFDTAWPSHYNPMSNPRRKYTYGVKHPTKLGSQMGFQVQLLPRFCQRSIATYKRCLVANDDSAHICQQQQDNILSVCPNFALDAMRQKKLTFLKMQAMNNKKYKEVMEVASYNSGRTVANVPRKSWSDGRGQNLRPDSMWFDDRYVDITQKQINQAKERVKSRQQAKGFVPNNQIHFDLIDRKFQKIPEKIPLYP